MSEDERENADPSANAIDAPSILDAKYTLESAPASFIGDFSNNSFLFVDGKLTKARTPESAEEACGRMTRQIAGLHVVCEDAQPVAELDTGSNSENIGSTVYIETAVDLFQKINGKLELLLHKKSTEEKILERCHASLLSNNPNAAMAAIRPYSNLKISKEDVVTGFIEDEWPGYLCGLRGDFASLREKLSQMRDLFSRLVGKIGNKTDVCDHLKAIINRQSIEHSKQIDTLVSESNSLKEGLVDILKRFGPEGSLDSGLETDLLSNVRALVQRQAEEISVHVRSEMEKDLAIEGFRSKASSYEVAALAKQIEEYKRDKKHLQAENLNFSQAIHRLSEKNIKHKQDLILFNNELKKSISTLKVKNETIARQKSLISLFQEKLNGSVEYPIEELKIKRREIEDRIEKEDDYLKKEYWRKEKLDCDKRLADFIKLRQKK